MAVYQIDEATKLYTEEFMREGLDELLKKGNDLAFIYFKVDFLNKEHNNLIDMALKDIARIIRNQLRNLDSAVKLGDKIVLILPSTTRLQAEIIMERIVKKIESPGFMDGYTVLSMPKKLITDVFIYPQEIKTKEEIVEKIGHRG